MSKLTPKDITTELERVLQSDEFQRSARLSKFLRYIVEKHLAGEDDKITGYNIGIDVFNKPHDFDSDNDSAVRVEAIRLRKALALYFHEQGSDDPIVIKVPSGAYKPVFLRNTPSPANLRPRRKAISIKIFLPAFVLTCLMLVVLWSAFLREPERYDFPRVPAIAVGHFDFIGVSASKDNGSDFAYLLHQKLSHFSALKSYVLTKHQNEEDQPHYDYILEGRVNLENDILTISATLTDKFDDTDVWSFDRRYMSDDASPDGWKEHASTSIISAIASMHGIIDTLEAQKYAHDTDPANQGYRCLLAFKSYDGNKTIEKHKFARDCLEKLVAHFPDYSPGWTYLSWVYGDEVRGHLNLRSDEDTARKRSLDAALKAVETSQRNARAHMYLASAAFLNNDLALMKRHTAISIDLNPYDSDVLASASWKYGRIGDWELSKKYAEQSLALNPTPPKWYHKSLFVYEFHVSNYDKALFHALAGFQEDDFVSRLSLIAAYVGTGQMKKAQELTEATKLKFSDSHEKLRQFLNAWGSNREWGTKFAAHLKQAGFSVDPREN